jgi:hypothetical protein
MVEGARLKSVAIGDLLQADLLQAEVSKPSSKQSSKPSLTRLATFRSFGVSPVATGRHTLHTPQGSGATVLRAPLSP